MLMRMRVPLHALVGATMLVGLAWLVLTPPPRATGEQSEPGLVVRAPRPMDPMGAHRMGAGVMSEAAMKQMADTWWAKHPPVGASSHQVQSATFTAQNFRFDTDFDAATQIDTAKISVGQTVLWQWINGGHTVTSGAGSDDPAMGALFNQPLDTTHHSFSFTFNTAGTFPFFCGPHELSDMKGVVVVSGTAGVPPAGSGPLGFTADPSPNPTRTGAGFSFALRVAGRCRAEVFDARGRRAAVPLDEELLPGPHAGAWDGRTLAGTRAAAGIYYLRLTLPGYAGSRTIAVTR